MSSTSGHVVHVERCKNCRHIERRAYRITFVYAALVYVGMFVGRQYGHQLAYEEMDRAHERAVVLAGDGLVAEADGDTGVYQTSTGAIFSCNGVALARCATSMNTRITCFEAPMADTENTGF